MSVITLTEAAEVLNPPIPRRELARRLKDVAACGSVYGRRGRRAALYPVREIMLVHADWVRDVLGKRSSGVPEFGPSSPCPETVPRESA